MRAERGSGGKTGHARRFASPLDSTTRQFGAIWSWAPFLLTLSTGDS